MPAGFDTIYLLTFPINHTGPVLCYCVTCSMVLTALYFTSSGGPDEVHGRPNQANERDTEWHKDPEILCLGEGLSRAGFGLQRERAQGSEEISNPLLHLHCFLQLLIFSGA